MEVSKKHFIRSLETTLMLADSHIISLELEGDDTVIVHFKGGRKKRINIAMDSHIAIIKDVMRGID